MSHTDSELQPAHIAETDISNIAEQIAPLMGRMLAGRTIKQVEIGESFRVWIVEDEMPFYLKTAKNLSAIAKSTQTYHHQIFIDGNPEAFARSELLNKPNKNHNWIIKEVAMAPLASMIDNAYTDIHDLSHGPVFMLVIPSRDIVALWLLEACRVHIVSAPQNHKGISVGETYSELHLLKFLQHDNPVIGIYAEGASN